MAISMAIGISLLDGEFWPVTGTVNSMIHGKRVVVDLPAFKDANML